MSRDRHFPRKTPPADRSHDLGRHAAQIAKAAQLNFGEQQRNQRRPRLDQVEPKLSRHFVTESGRAHLGDGQAAGSYDQRSCLELIAFAVQREAAAMPTLSTFTL